MGSSIAPTVGPPTTATTFAYAGFGAHEAVDVYFDTTDVALSSANHAGDGSVSLTIPASGAPGTHWITAVGRHTGDSAQSSFLVQENWAQEGDAPAHHGRNSFENVLSPTTVGGLGELYRVGPGENDDFPPRGVTVEAGNVYVAYQIYGLTSYDEATGAQHWNLPLSSGSDFLTTAPAVHGTTVYVGTVSKLIAANTANGAVRWTFAPPGAAITGAPTVSNHVVYVTSNHDVVYALNATTGSLLWQFNPTDGATSQPFGEPAVYDGDIYVALDNGVYALNESTGVAAWDFATGSNPSGSVTVVGGSVLAPFGTTLYALSTVNGGTRWTYTASSNVGSPAAGPGMVYVGVADNEVRGLSAGTGQVQWSSNVSAAYAQGNRPSVADGVVYVGTDNGFFAIAASYGGQLWSSADNVAFGSPPVVDGTVFASERGDLARYGLNGDASPTVARPNPAKLRHIRLHTT
jgi:outer membrane protein assembly factor BamB